VYRGASAHQRFMHGVKVLMARNYSDNLSEEVQKGLLEKNEMLLSLDSAS
jgi:5-formaminoimidazole-4-carboxamide-1-beta-D-ribofuranosyl 5'-monophosphate synthetase